jgi:YidC/Oxa1 family membrane protein insertase
LILSSLIFGNTEMENKNDSSSQIRFLLAFILSMAVLFGWPYFFSSPEQVTKQGDDKSVTEKGSPVANTTSPAPQANPTQQVPAAVSGTQQLPVVTVPENPPRTIRIKTDLYELELDSRGAVARSWVILKDKSPKGERLLFGDGSTRENRKPLQLISDEARKRGQLPFRLKTSDQTVNDVANSRNYGVSTTESSFVLKSGEKKEITFSLTERDGIEVKKTFIFSGDSYVSDLKLDVRKGGKIVDTKLAIGASIGDHAINNHTFYHIESETVASINDDITRHQGYYSFEFDSNRRGVLSDTGNLDWAGVGDAYFAMVAIPAVRTQGLEHEAFSYDVQTKPFFSGIFSWIIRSETTNETRHLVTTYVPVTADGTTTKIFTGTKDYFLLTSLNETLSSQVGRPIDIEDLINFSNYSFIRYITKPLSVPILYALDFLNNYTANYGVAIILFTFIFYSFLFPLRWSQSKSFKKAAANAPKMKEIQDKIKALQKKGVPLESPEMRKLQMEQLKMTKDALPIGGCLPMLLQFPLLIAFYTAVTVSLALRQADFMWLPDLSAADPYHILEFGFAISMVLSMKFTPTSPTITPEQQMQQKIMIYLMPVMMLWIMWQAPSGLLLYWFFGNIVSFGQQMIINRINRTPEEQSGQLVDSVPKDAKKVN